MTDDGRLLALGVALLAIVGGGVVREVRASLQRQNMPVLLAGRFWIPIFQNGQDDEREVFDAVTLASPTEREPDRYAVIVWFSSTYEDFADFSRHPEGKDAAVAFYLRSRDLGSVKDRDPYRAMANYVENKLCEGEPFSGHTLYGSSKPELLQAAASYVMETR